jgi:hypothetical protein
MSDPHPLTTSRRPSGADWRRHATDPASQVADRIPPTTDRQSHARFGLPLLTHRPLHEAHRASDVTDGPTHLIVAPVATFYGPSRPFLARSTRNQPGSTDLPGGVRRQSDGPRRLCRPAIRIRPASTRLPTRFNRRSPSSRASLSRIFAALLDLRGSSLDASTPEQQILRLRLRMTEVRLRMTDVRLGMTRVS